MKKKSSLVLGTILSVLFFSSGDLMKAGAAEFPKEIKIALVYPLSGVLSRNGNLTVQGIKAAMKWVNDNGGIKSMGGAKLVPVVADCGSNVEGAASTMERVCSSPDIAMAMGSWASSLTMASSEITERLEVPHFSISYADALHNRGFKWGFYVTTPSSGMTGVGLPKLIEMAKSAGVQLKTSMIVGDDTVSGKKFYDTAKKILADHGIKNIAEEGWSMGTLTDATPVMQKVKSLNPDLVIFHASAIAEAQMCLMKKKELGVKVPFISFGGYAADPSFRQVGAEALEGLIAVTGSFPNKMFPEEWMKRTLEQCKKEYSDEPWIGQELSFGWITIPIMAEILERTGSTNRKAIRETAVKLDIHDVMATRATVGQGIAFDQNQRLAKKYQNILFAQFQDGVPKLVYPPNLAQSNPRW